MKTNYHTHTTWCDGKDTPEAVVVAAIEKGFYAIGFSSHAMLPEDDTVTLYNRVDGSFLSPTGTFTYAEADVVTPTVGDFTVVSAFARDPRRWPRWQLHRGGGDPRPERGIRRHGRRRRGRQDDT